MSLGWYIGLTATGKSLIRAIDTSSGSGDASKMVRTNSAGKLDLSLIPPGVGAPTLSIVCSESVTAGQLLNIHNSSGLKVRRADASNGRAAHVFTLTTHAANETVTVYGPGQELTGLTGLSIGSAYVLSYTTAGAVLLEANYVPATGRGYQFVGFASSTTSLLFLPDHYHPCVL